MFLSWTFNRPVMAGVKSRRTEPQTSLSELTRQVQTDADALREMLNLLIRKGRGRKWVGKPWGGCHRCALESLELYEWVHAGSGGEI